MDRQVKNANKLHRELSARLLSMIAIGGAIGTGIFLASGNAIHMAGPGGTMLAYIITGTMVYFLMTSLGEMAAFMPTTGSFYVYASQFVDPALGFAFGLEFLFYLSFSFFFPLFCCSLGIFFFLFWFLWWCQKIPPPPFCTQNYTNNPPEGQPKSRG